MIIKALLASFCAFFLSIQSQACSCIAVGEDFFSTVANHNEKVSTGEWPSDMKLTVVTAEVVGYMQLREGPLPTEMVLEVDGVLQGELGETEIVVEGDNGAQCRPYVTQFPIGKKFAFALMKQGPFHEVSVCGQYFQEITAPSGKLSSR